MVCPFLVGLKPTDLRGPLVQFQATQAIESDSRKLVASLNRALEKESLLPATVDRAFDKWWPELEKGLHQLDLADAPCSSASDRGRREIRASAPNAAP